MAEGRIDTFGEEICVRDTETSWVGMYVHSETGRVEFNVASGWDVHGFCVTDAEFEKMVEHFQQMRG